MKLSEQIEALSSRWRKRADFAATHLNMGTNYLECVGDLAPFLVRAKEQEAELAALQGRLEMEGMAHMLSVKNAIDELATLKEQHSADLLAIAEMAIAKCEEKYLPAIRYMYANSGICAEMGCGCTASQIIAPVLWADMRKELVNAESILSAWRERKAASEQQKSKGG